VTHREIRDNLRLIVVPLLGGVSMLIVAWVLRVLLLAYLPRAALLCLEVVAATGTFFVVVHVLGPAALSDARALLRELLRPGKTAGTGAVS
jgi:zinc transporter ZupT